MTVTYSGLSSGPSPYPNTGPSAMNPNVPNYGSPWFGQVGHLGGAATLGGAGGGWGGIQGSIAPSPNDFYQQYGASALTSQLIAPLDATRMQQQALFTLRNQLEGQQNALQTQKLRDAYAHDLAQQNMQAGDIAARRTRLNLEPGFINRAYGLDVQAAELQKKQAGDTWTTGLANLYSDATSRGAMTTEGTRRHRGDLYTQMLRGMEAGDIGLGRAGLQKDTSFADLAQAKSRLENEAANLGVDANYLKQQLDRGLAEAGLSDRMNAMSLMTDMNSADYQRAKDAATISQQVWQAAQLPGGKEMLQQLGRNYAAAGRTPIPATPGRKVVFK